MGVGSLIETFFLQYLRYYFSGDDHFIVYIGQGTVEKDSGFFYSYVEMKGHVK